MKKVGDILYFSIGEVAKKIGRTTITLKSWQDWYDEQPEDIQQEFPLPTFRRDLDLRQTRFVEEAALPLFKKFRDAMVYGKMALTEKKKKILLGK